MLHRPNKGNVEGDVCLFFALLANSVSDVVKRFACRPDVGRVFRGGVTEATEDGVLIDLSSVSSEPAMACDELNKFAQGGVTEFSPSRICVHGWEP